MAEINHEKRISNLMERINASAAISKENKKEICTHLTYMRAKGCEGATIAKNLYCFEKFIMLLPKGVNLKTAKREDIEQAIAKVGYLPLSEQTKRNIKIIVKVYYKHALGDDETYPRQVSWLKTGMKISKKLLPENILDEDEIIKLLDAVNDARDKALIAVLFDTGMRVGELLNMKFGDVDQASHHIVIKGKTGMRRLMLFFSIPYINNYLVSTKKRNPNEYLWLGRGKWTARNRPIDRAAVAKLLRVAARKAGIQKRIYPHLFRHSRATYYASRMKEQTLKSYFGWTSGSAMAATYVHLSGRDMDAAVLEANGEKMPEKADKARLKAPVCHVCKKENIVGSVHCSQCGSALDVETALVAERLQAYGMVHGTSEELFKKYFDDYMKRYMEEKERAGK